jgi:succinoglycan biosynthesis protein ExoA
VSVVIAVRDEARAIEACLDALAAQSYPPERFEVLVVDGDSEDDTVARATHAAARTGLDLTVLANRRRNTPAGFNRGIEAARGEVIVILGARARIEADFLEASVRALARSGADAVGGRVTTVAGAPGRVAAAIALAQRSPFGVGDAGYRYAATARDVDTVNYGAYRREVFDRVGLFDESMQWVEDDELNYRLRAAGGKLRLEPAIAVEYAARPTLAGLWRQRFLWGLNKLRVAEQHPGQMRPRHAVPAVFVLALAGMALLRLRGGRWRWPLRTLTGAYGLASLAATLRLGARHRWPPETPLLPLAFLTMHLAYGCGTLAGVAVTARRRLMSRRGRMRDVTRTADC